MRVDIYSLHKSTVNLCFFSAEGCNFLILQFVQFIIPVHVFLKLFSKSPH